MATIACRGRRTSHGFSTPSPNSARVLSFGRESAMTTEQLLRAFCEAVEQRNGKAFADLFSDDGVYHDVFYGAFAGRAKIAEMIDEVFYATATDFRWDMHSPLSDGAQLYARYTFSYRSMLPEAKDARVMFEGVAMMTLT